jgi:hypothetical protein
MERDEPRGAVTFLVHLRVGTEARVIGKGARGR